MVDPAEIARAMNVRDGSREERCDFCAKWSALSSGRVMGWCAEMSDRPAPLPIVLLLGGPYNEITAYNQVCDNFAGRQHIKEADDAAR